MKYSVAVISIFIGLMLILNTSTAGNYENESQKNRSYNDAWYDLEKQYPSPDRRYSRKELDQARRRANNSVWMEKYGKKDPIYKSDQYGGRYSRKELDKARRRANNSVWMEKYGKKDPIYKSNQYRGRSSDNYSQPYQRYPYYNYPGNNYPSSPRYGH